jgi:hypothetical protein
MREKLEEILSMLRKEYSQRQDLISDNVRDIENNPADINSIDTKMEFDEINKELRKRNNTNIELQQAIDKYIKDNSKFPTESSRSISYEECFQLTISGDMDYNPRNPFFFDLNFYSELMTYFIEKENYTMCHLIKRRRDEVFGPS